MDITNSLAPRSDQINADDLVAGPQTFTIREVIGGKAEQPYDFLLVETERAFRPAVTMRRLIAAAWGVEADQYVGRRLTVYRDPTIRFGKDVVGGVRISHMSHIDGRVEVKVQVTRGRRETFAVEPLPDLTPAEALRAEWRTADPERREAIEAEVAALTNGAQS
ncbi:hypothetical protein EFK50_07705 [Nocardioides marmoriginsengisoli]|uniref:Uncharacterized protein n=1 Tax=Nocardioides marmoriginsengisoli TaxID=661483 RepID=A0A3N0CLZ6_9ACTN|nr:hypothetical protein [Nocardioides marmoriginsengisoli]RNL64400.1 hypothetical protein EFK50_07705 [Nocardioides marmoriginsengisoli]